MTAIIHYRLQMYLAERYPGARVADFAFLTSGFESDVYTFDLERPGQARLPLILRLYPGAGAAEKMAREARGLALLRQAGYPAPAMLLPEPGAGVLGKPFNVMERLDGSSLWPVLAGAAPEEANRLLEEMAGLLARLHRLDWRPFVDDAARYEADPALLLREMLAGYRQQFAQFDAAEFVPLIDWLESRLGSIRVRPAVAHLDFHANNVFLRRDGRMAVIDWTQVSAADYRCDLTWTLLIMGDFGLAAWGERLLEAYQRAAGPVEDLAYFQVLTDTKILSSKAIARKSGPAALGMRPETAEAEADAREARVLRRLAERVEEITGVVVPVGDPKGL